MTKISKSPQRHTFQKEGYLRRCKENGEEPNKDYLDMFEKILEDDDKKFDDPETTRNNMEYDLLTTDWILEKARTSEVYAQNLYAALCNNEFQKLDVIPILKEERWGCSWRYAGGIIADMRKEGDYIDWYCSGIRDTGEMDDDQYQQLTKEQQERYIVSKKFVGESVVTDEVRQDLQKLGWIVVESNEEDL